MTIRNKDTYTKEEVKKLFLAMSKAAGNMAEEEEDLTVEQLREKLEKKRLKEELAKKGSKQSRTHDESILGVCKTCHFPIYYGEVIYTPHEVLTENEYSGEVLGGYSALNNGAQGIGAGRYQGRGKRKSSSEGWIQCGFCYQIYEKDLAKLKQWDKARKYFLWFFTSPVALLLVAIGYFVDKQSFGQTFAVWFIGGAFVGYIIGFLIHLAIYKQRPIIERYKLRIKERKEYELGREEKKVVVKQYEGEVSF